MAIEHDADLTLFATAKVSLGRCATRRGARQSLRCAYRILSDIRHRLDRTPVDQKTRRRDVANYLVATRRYRDRLEFRFFDQHADIDDRSLAGRNIEYTARPFEAARVNDDAIPVRSDLEELIDPRRDTAASGHGRIKCQLCIVNGAVVTAGTNHKQHLAQRALFANDEEHARIFVQFQSMGCKNLANDVDGVTTRGLSLDNQIVGNQVAAVRERVALGTEFIDDLCNGPAGVRHSVAFGSRTGRHDQDNNDQ